MLTDSIIHFLLGFIVHKLLGHFTEFPALEKILKSRSLKLLSKHRGSHLLKNYIESCLHMGIGILAHLSHHILEHLMRHQ